MPALAPADQARVAYRNPVLPGFFPDPSVVRVGADYYLINSTFQYFPAIVISHSRDLVHWRQIGHVFTNPEELDLTGYLDGCGIWAPDISYHDGHFYIFYCLVQLTPDRTVNVRGNYMVRSRDILGPYSKPVQLTTEGNDPSHFVDEDGAHYMLYAAGIPRGKGVKIVRLSDDCTRVVGSPSWLEFEPEKRAPEGPHLLRKDGYYYLTMAAGDGVYRGHHQVVARSRHVLGPYEPSPHPPFIVEHSADASFYHHGHAKLVETADRGWWCVYLMRRRISGFSPLGRETAVDRIDWLEDGWPVLNHGEGPSDHAPLTVHSNRAFQFEGPELDLSWCFIRRPPFDGYCLASRPGHLRLRGGSSGLDSPTGVCAVLRREACHRYVATTRVEFYPRPGEEAGLVCYYDTDNHVQLVLANESGARLQLSARARGTSTLVADLPVSAQRPVWLRLEVDGLDRSFSFSHDGETWNHVATLGDCGFMSDEGTSGWGFTGTMVGFYARRAPDQLPLQADFAMLLLSENPPIAKAS